MKAILISIKPKYVAKILNGEKTIEIRKTMPKCDLPIDVYIYCCKDRKYGICWNDCDDICGKVVAKFTLKKVEEIKFDDKEVQRKACLTEDELFDYLFDNTPYQEDMKKGYAWHISNLEFFDKPKELSEFHRIVLVNKLEGYEKPLTKAPQSWRYVEVE